MNSQRVGYALLIVLAAVDLKKLGIPDSIAYSESVSLYRIIFIISILFFLCKLRCNKGQNFLFLLCLYCRQRTMIVITWCDVKIGGCLLW